MRTSKVPLRDETGEVYGVLGTSEDITDLVESRQALEDARADLERKNQELSSLLFVTSHDLRRPLVTIQGFVSELQRSVQDLLGLLDGVEIPPERAKRIGEIVNDDIPAAAKYISGGVTALDEMLRGILDISRLDRAGFEMQTVDMQQLVADIVAGMGSEIERAGASLTVGPLPCCFGDPARLAQVVTNLLANAVKYLDPGRTGALRITGQIQGKQVVYCVEDNGIGIAADRLSRVFDMFYRAAPEHADGEGLGLASVRAIVGKHGGRTWAESELGKGARFYISLPGLRGQAKPRNGVGR
jgi:signal transduction histidine kinase